MTSELAARLDRAQQTAQPIGDATQLLPAEAMEVQREIVRLRLQRGERRAGVKLAFTNRALMERLGVLEPALGELTASMQLENGSAVDAGIFIRPRIECELIARLDTPLGAGARRDEAARAIGAIAPAIEVIDSRFTQRPFQLSDVIADNASAAAFVVGTWSNAVPDLAALRVSLEHNGTMAAHGSTADIFGHPLDALCTAADLAHRIGEPLDAGALVLLGSAIDPYVPEIPSTVVVSVESLGSVSLRFTAASFPLPGFPPARARCP